LRRLLADPEFPVAGFERATWDLVFEPGVGIPGRVWATGKPAAIPDVLLDLNFPRIAEAHRSGLHGALGLPVRDGEEVLAVAEFYFGEARAPEPELVDALQPVVDLIARLIAGGGATT
jgi:hypothetical protein